MGGDEKGRHQDAHQGPDEHQLGGTVHHRTNSGEPSGTAPGIPSHDPAPQDDGDDPAKKPTHDVGNDVVDQPGHSQPDHDGDPT